MIVYRRIHKNDLNKYLNNEKIKGSNINTILHGRSFGIYYNNHRYSYDTKYVHFFKDLVDARDYVAHIPIEFESVVLAFDIPNKFLKKYEGRGIYEFNNETVVAIEYAIPQKQYKTEWFKGVVNEDKLTVNKRKKVDYTKTDFGFMNTTNEAIDKYINSHIIENETTIEL